MRRHPLSDRWPTFPPYTYTRKGFHGPREVFPPRDNLKKATRSPTNHPAQSRWGPTIATVRKPLRPTAAHYPHPGPVRNGTRVALPVAPERDCADTAPTAGGRRQTTPGAAEAPASRTSPIEWLPGGRETIPAPGPASTPTPEAPDARRGPPPLGSPRTTSRAARADPRYLLPFSITRGKAAAGARGFCDGLAVLGQG